MIETPIIEPMTVLRLLPGLGLALLITLFISARLFGWILAATSTLLIVTGQWALILLAAALLAFGLRYANTYLQLKDSLYFRILGSDTPRTGGYRETQRDIKINLEYSKFREGRSRYQGLIEAKMRGYGGVINPPITTTWQVLVARNLPGLHNLVKPFRPITQARLRQDCSLFCCFMNYHWNSFQLDQMEYYWAVDGPVAVKRRRTRITQVEILEESRLFIPPTLAGEADERQVAQNQDSLSHSDEGRRALGGSPPPLPDSEATESEEVEPRLTYGRPRWP
jgi:hypothetical protein